MTYLTLEETRERVAPSDIWKLDPVLEALLKRQIYSLPSTKNLSKLECRYPEDKKSLRAFLDKFFARHLFQVQNAILQQDTFERLLQAIRNENVTIADIGCGPAVASIAILNLISHICVKTKKAIKVSVVLNDNATEILSVGKSMLDTYAKQLNNIYVTQNIALDTPFPDSMVQLRRISNMLAPYDLCCLSYVLIPLKEEASYNKINEQLQNLVGCCNSRGTGLIVQDKFRESLARHLGSLLKASVKKLNLCQKIYDSNNSFSEYSYDYFRIAFFPDNTY